MRRFITYIYEYEQGNRGRNTGFIRTDLRENSCRMELQIRGFDRFKGKCPVYLTVYENGLQAIPVTELLLTQGMGSGSPKLLLNRKRSNSRKQSLNQKQSGSHKPLIRK